MKVNPVTYARAYLSAVNSVPVAKRDEVARNLWQAVWRRGHFKWRNNILSSVRALIREQKGIMLAEVSTPRELTESQKNHLADQLSKSSGRSIELACTVKPHLLAGLVVTIEDERYDASLKGRLDALYNTLAGEDKSS